MRELSLVALVGVVLAILCGLCLVLFLAMCCYDLYVAGGEEEDWE